MEFFSRMNQFGAERLPFLFIIDFEMNKPVILPLSLVNEETVWYDIEGNSNAGSAESNQKAFPFEKKPVDFETYKKAFDRVVKNIHYGNSFLVNLTFPTEIKTNMGLKDIFLRSKAKYKLFFDDHFVVFSPEIFVEIIEGKIYSYPMKGTIDAGIPNAREIILNDSKEQAEHATITDLIRNDLSRVATNVRVDKYRYIDTLKTNQKDLLQVSSKISGALPGDYHSQLGDIFLELLPAGSISGAPKTKTLEIIRNAEGQERGYFTGVFGIYDGENLKSAVMIRYIEQSGNQLFFRSGGGITASSNLDKEYEEMINKVYVPVY